MSQYQTPPTHPPDLQRPPPTGPPSSAGKQPLERLTSQEKERSSYLKMLSNIANDLDVLLTDLCHKHPCHSSAGGSEGGGGGETGSDNAPGGDGDQGTLNALTQHSGDTLGKDSFLSSGEAASRRLGDTTGSSQSLISSSSDNLSEDSGHDERTQGTTSPLVFDPNHFGPKSRNVDHISIPNTAVTMTPQLAPSTVCSRDNDSHSSGDLRPINLVERLAKTHSIWLLSQMSRAGAVHLLKDRATGVFIIRKSSQPNSLALSVQNRMTDRANVDHYLIEASTYGMRLQGSAHFFHSIPSLIAHYIENLDELPYCLTLPAAIFQARSSRELASLAMLGQDFWLSPVSRKSRTPSPACYYGGTALHKSCSEPIDIRQPLQLHAPAAAAAAATPPRPYTSNTPPFHPLHGNLHHLHHHHNVAVVAPSSSRSVSDFSDFMTSQQVQEEQEAALNQHQHQQQFSGSRTAAVAGSGSALPRRIFASASASASTAGVGGGVRSAGGGFGPHVLRLKGLNDTPTSTDSSGGEEDGGRGGMGLGVKRGDSSSNNNNVPCIQLVGGDPEEDRADSPQSLGGGAMSDASSQTDFTSLQGHRPKGRPNLYSMTPAELLNLQENNTYFRSSLSDKMSDYEDIWRSSFYDTDSVRNGSVRGGVAGQGGSSSGAGLDGESCTATARSDFTKFFAVNGGDGTRNGAAKPVTVVVSMDRDEGAIVTHAATQADERPPVPPKNWETGEVVVVVAEPKLLHPPGLGLGGRLSRLKSSSDSSLATVSSPVYAEPADAVVFRDRQARPSARARVRRRSAPSVSSQAIHPEHLLPAPHGASVASSSKHPHLPPPSHPPPPPAAVGEAHKLTTIVSRHDALTHSGRGLKKAESQPRKVGGGVAVLGGGDPRHERGGHASGVSRSQSMRTPQEAARLSKKKPGWQERFNRLKLGTKVLTQSGSPYATSSRLGVQPQLDDSLFATETENSSGGPSSAAAINRFPVYHRGKLFHSVNRGSYFSESSTVQDLISCAMPELMVRPIQTHHHPQHLTTGAASLSAASGKQLSEYDNFNPYAPPSAASSHGTVFCTPWEGSVVDTLLRSSTSTQLPPAMDLQERVQKWQEANQTFQQHQHGHYQQHEQLPQSKQVYSQREQQAHQAYQQQARHHHQQQQQVHHQYHGGPVHHQQQQLQQPQQQQNQQPALRQSANVVKQAHTVQTANAVTGGNAGAGVVVSSSGAVVGPSVAVKNASRAVVPPTKTQTRPHSMYQPQNQGSAHQHPQLTRSFSNPSQQPPQSQLARSHPHLHQHQSQRLPGQQPGHHHWQGCQLVAEESSGVTPDSRIGGLSSNCPDVINCHHIAMDTGDAALSDDEILLQTVHSTQRGPQQKQTAQTPGSKIREYIYKLSHDQSTIFGSTIENFIQCTVDSQERTPHHVMRNVRQFMTGIKNYLVKHGEGELEDLIERERNKLGNNKILNIDALIETTLHMCVLRPLKHHIYRLFVDFHGRNNSLELMSRNIKYARTKTAEEIGIKPGLVPPQSSDMETIKHYLDKMQRAYSPLKKLENLLGATTAIYNCVKVQGKQHVHTRGPASLGADDFLPLLIYVLVHCGLVSAEIEADYMWGLLHPSVLTGEGGYYLTTLSSAVLILKNFQEAHESKTASLEGQLPTLGEVQGFLKIAFPDELRDTILWKTLPVRPNMTTKDVCAMIAHKFKITNPQDYGLLLLCDGEESQLSDNTCPQILKKDNLAAGKESFFAYKRLGANIAWPSSMKHS